MDGNYEWQRFRAAEKLRARRQEADAQRQAGEAGKDSRSAVSSRIFAPFRTVWAALIRHRLREGLPDASHSGRREERERLV